MKNIDQKKLISILYPLISVALSIFIAECYCGQHFLMRGIFFYALNIFTYFLLYSLTYLVTGKIKLSGMVTYSLSGFMGLVHYYAKLFRGNPFMAADCFSLGTAADVASHYSLSFEHEVVICSIIFIVLLIVLKKIRVDETIFQKSRFITRGLAFVYILFAVWFFFISNIPVHLSLLSFDAGIDKVYENNGSFPGFILSARKLKVRAPFGYSVKKVLEITDKYKNEEICYENDGVNLIVVVDESFSDIMRNHPEYISEDNMPFLHSMKDDFETGTLVASIFGGNTANSEFEFLTGFTMAFEPYGMVSFQNIEREVPSINYTLQADGYSGIYGMHPGKPDSWKRDVVYPFLGFERFMSKEDFAHQDSIRGFVSDKACLAQILDEYETLSDQREPVYIYGMTIQNHGGYEDEGEGLNQSIEVVNEELSDDEKLKLYVNLIKETDSAVESLVKPLAERDEKVMVLFFGDHLPGMDKSTVDILSKGERDFKFDSPFYLWANFDIPEENIGKISMNYLGAYLLNRAGATLSPYERYLLDLRKDIPVLTLNGYTGSDGKYYEISDKSSPYYQKVLEYEYLQYNALYDNDVDMEFFYPE